MARGNRINDRIKFMLEAGAPIFVVRPGQWSYHLTPFSNYTKISWHENVIRGYEITEVFYDEYAEIRENFNAGT
jgi:hypothetical protein